MATYGVVRVTAGSEAEADAIASALVHEKLAACVSLLPIRSVYTWQGSVHRDPEWQLVIKTDLSQFARLEGRIRELHSYEVPEIIALPVTAGAAPYLRWIGDQVAD